MDRVEIKIIGNAIQGELGVKVLQYVFHNIGCQQFRGIALRLEHLYKTQEPEKSSWHSRGDKSAWSWVSFC